MQLVPLYQPIMDLSRSSTFAYEATIRGNLQGRWISAERIIQLVTQRGEIAAFDQQVHRIATYLAPKTTKLFLNCEVETLIERNLSLFSNCNRIVIEITERTPMSNKASEIREYLQPFREKGLQIAIDDFGTGFANFEVVADLQPDYIKIDRSLLRHNSNPISAKKFIHGICEFARSIDALVISEGVETQEHHELIIEEGIPYGQGFYYGHPKQRDLSEDFFTKPEGFHREMSNFRKR